VKFIPKKPGSDWRDLPNIEVQIAKDVWTEKLKYHFRDFKLGANRGNPSYSDRQ